MRVIDLWIDRRETAERQKHLIHMDVGGLRINCELTTHQMWLLIEALTGARPDAQLPVYDMTCPAMLTHGAKAVQINEETLNVRKVEVPDAT